MSRIYIDMDGVLARWNEAASEEETHQKGYFIAREPELSALAMVRLLVDAGEDVCILSSVYQDDHSVAEKQEWLQYHGLGDVKAVFVPYGEAKSDYVENGDNILIDDYSKNLRKWEEEGYRAIKFMNGINNRPKLTIVNGVVAVTMDSWEGYSIDHRMSPRQMATVVLAIAREEVA